MNKSVLLLALAVMPLSLLAQHKPTTRRTPASSARQMVSRPAAVRPATANPVTSKANTSTAASGTNSVSNTQMPASPTATRPEAATGSTPITTASVKSTESTRGAKSAPVARVQATSITDQSSGFRIGLRAGGSGATVSGLTASDIAGASLDPVTGFHAGVVISVGRRAFTVQPEVLYSQYGFKLTAGSDYVQMKYNVIEVPVLLKYTFGQSTTRFFVNAGPTATYLLGGTITLKEAGETAEGKLEIGAGDGRFNYGGSAGVGIALKAGQGNLLIEARGTYLTSSETNVSLQSGKLSVAYLLPLGGR